MSIIFKRKKQKKRQLFRSLREVELMESGKMKATSLDEFLATISDGKKRLFGVTNRCRNRSLLNRKESFFCCKKRNSCYIVNVSNYHFMANNRTGSGDASPPRKYDNDTCQCPRPREQFMFPRGQGKVSTGRCMTCRKKIPKDDKSGEPFVPPGSIITNGMTMNKELPNTKKALIIYQGF